MIQQLLAKVVGTQNERELKKLRPLVAQINALEPSVQPLSDDALRAKTVEFKQRFANGETLDQLLPEAFAVVREVGRRVLNMRHFDVQLIGGSDITYGTNNEFGFDYLRDNMKFELAHYVQRGHHFAIVDEVDSILIDEARTPLIISGPAELSTDLYYEVDRIVPRLKAGSVIRGDVKAEEREALEATGDYIADEKHKTVTLTDSGTQKS